MSCPSKVLFQQHGFNAGALGLLLNDNVCGNFTQVSVDDGAETAMMKASEETDVTAVGDPSLWAIEESGKDHSLLDMNCLCLVIQAFVAPNTFVQSTKQTICLWESVVNSFVDPCIRWDDTAQVSKLLCWLQFTDYSYSVDAL